MNRDDAANPKPTRRLAVRWVNKLQADGELTEEATVLCGWQGRAVPLVRCERCPRLDEVLVDAGGRKAYIECEAPPERVQPSPVVPTELRKVFPRAADPVASLMRRDIVAVCPDVRVSVVTQLFAEAGVTSAPVVDGAGRLVGVVTKKDLSEAPPITDSVALEATASSVMKPIALRLNETAPITQAAALLAYEGVDSMPVVTASDHVVGMIYALDILLWLARHDGYLDPHLPERDRLDELT